MINGIAYGIVFKANIVVFHNLRLLNTEAHRLQRKKYIPVTF